MKLQENKIIKSDCINYLNLIQDKSVNLIVIDPPYNELPSKWDNFNGWKKIKTEFERVLKDNGQIYIFGKQPMLSEIFTEFKDLFSFRFEIVWNKNKGTWASNYMPMRSHELIWCFKKNNTKITDLYYDIESIKTPGEPYVRKNKAVSTIRNNWKANLTIIKDGRRFPLSVIEHQAISRKDKKEGQPHPTQKPLKIIEMLIESSSKKNDLILDCFIGSGTTAIGALKLERRFLGCDIEQEFVDLSNKRIEEFKKESIRQMGLFNKK